MRIEGNLIASSTMMVDGLADVGEWYVSEGEHDRAAREQFQRGEAMLLGRRTYEGLAAYLSSEDGPWASLLNPTRGIPFGSGPKAQDQEHRHALPFEQALASAGCRRWRKSSTRSPRGRASPASSASIAETRSSS